VFSSCLTYLPMVGLRAFSVLPENMEDLFPLSRIRDKNLSGAFMSLSVNKTFTAQTSDSLHKSDRKSRNRQSGVTVLVSKEWLGRSKNQKEQSVVIDMVEQGRQYFQQRGRRRFRNINSSCTKFPRSHYTHTNMSFLSKEFCTPRPGPGKCGS